MANKDRLDNLNNRFDNELLNMINQLVPYEKPAGDYVWKKLTTEGGDFVDYVVSDDLSAYPDRGYVGSYWYELFDPTTLIAENIREGIDIWGVIGAMKEGVNIAELFGCTKMAVDKFTFSSATALDVAITHSLGMTPKKVFVFTDSHNIKTRMKLYNGYACEMYNYVNNNTINCTAFTHVNTSNLLTTAMRHNKFTFRDTWVSLEQYGSGYGYEAGAEYTLITMA